jgi:hypothetical protein
MVETEIAEELICIRNDMQEFVNKQLLGWIQEGVTSGLSKLPPPPSALIIEQIREVVRKEQPKENPFLDQVQIAKWERQYQKEKENVTKLIQEHWKKRRRIWRKG